MVFHVRDADFEKVRWVFKLCSPSYPFLNFNHLLLCPRLRHGNLLLVRHRLRSTPLWTMFARLVRSSSQSTLTSPRNCRIFCLGLNLRTPAPSTVPDIEFLLLLDSRRFVVLRRVDLRWGSPLLSSILSLWPKVILPQVLIATPSSWLTVVFYTWLSPSYWRVCCPSTSATLTEPWSRLWRTRSSWRTVWRLPILLWYVTFIFLLFIA